jgi:tetratricopeptide (TPR) repeat protein
MQTSYSIISIYKQRIAALDRAIHNPSRQGGQQQSSHSLRTVEYRKLLQRFRQFLAEEEKFWMQLVLRLRRYFLLEDAQPVLTTLGIVLDDAQTPAADGATYPRRNQHQFPLESDGSASNALVPTSAAQRESRMAILSKALVCLGDIARYKEQYNEAGGRPRAGHEDGPPAAMSGRGGRGRRGGAVGAGHAPLPRLRNYDRAQSCYEQARLLLPHDGNPSHQLAILSSYQKDTLSCIMHYYRALCVRSPYETASENLGTVLHKALEQYKTRGLLREIEAQEELATTGTITPRARVESFKEKVVVLHAQWCMNVDE